jgi:hypothetical protein
MELNFKNKSYNTLTEDQKRDMVERVCMDHFDYLKGHGINTAGLAFIKYWRDNIQELASPSDSHYLDPYFYMEGEGLCVADKETHFACVQFNTKEVVAFINNVVNDIPFRTPIIDALRSGATIADIKSRGVLADGYGNNLPNLKNMKGIRRGRKSKPDSLRQKILRGEISHYKAYQKKHEASEDDAL